MTALSTNAIAGAMIPAPQSVVLREKGFRELVSIKQIRDMNIRFIEQGVVARRAFAEKNGEIVKRFIQAVYDGLKLLHDDKTFATKVLSKYTKVTRQNMLDESYQASIDAFAKDLARAGRCLQGSGRAIGRTQAHRSGCRAEDTAFSLLR